MRRRRAGGFLVAPFAGGGPLLDTRSDGFLYSGHGTYQARRRFSLPMRERLDDDLKSAMRAGDAPRRGVLRYLLSAVHNQEIEKKGALDDEAITGLLGRQAQQRRDSIEAFRKGGRDDLVAKEEAELALIVEYLPQQLTDDEVRELAAKAIADAGASGPRDMGRVMGALMPQVRGRADGKTVSATVSELLRQQAG